VVFAVLPPGSDASTDEPLAEIKELLRSADIDWLSDVVQHREHAHPHSYLGRGKMDELKAAVKETGATVAVCEDDLTPAQVAAVLDVLDVDVLDRTELILSVFSKHAHSLEGTLQVHLAQLEYELTRMRGKGLVLSRLGAGVDMRGPGARSAPAACTAACRSSPSPGTRTPASRRSSTPSRAPRSPCATASSRPSTRRRAPSVTATATT
jgi:GTP-binding protein HflX